MACGYKNLWYTKDTVELSKVLLIGIRNSCVCLEENCSFSCLAPSRSVTVLPGAGCVPAFEEARRHCLQNYWNEEDLWRERNKESISGPEFCFRNKLLILFAA